MKRKYLLFLIGLFCIALLLRTYRLGDFPSGFHRDEAFLGYNAYSLLKTARDINGNFLPLHLQSFLYTPAGYSYLAIPFILIFGLSEFAVRFPSVLLGSLTIFSLFFLCVELLKSLKIEILKKYQTYLPFFCVFLLAISPWHINLSRTASVATVVVFFITSGVSLFLFSQNRKSLIFLLLSFFCFGASLFFYISPYSFLPLFIPVLLLCFQQKKNKPFSVILFVFIILLPLFVTLFSKNLSLRARTVSIFSSTGSQLVLDEKIREDGVVGASPTVVRFFHNKLSQYSNLFVQNYFDHLSFNFLFTDSGLPDRYRVPQTGLLYLFEGALLLCGIFVLLTNRSRASLFLFLWILVSPIGSALTSDDVPNLQRTLFMLPPFLVIESLGFFYFLTQIRLKKSFYFVSGIIILCSFAFYIHEYYVHAKAYRPWYRQDGYRELVNEVNKLLPHYKKAVITNRESAPTIFFLFFSKYSPSAFQKETRGTALHDFDRINFANYEFSQEECPVQEILSKDGAKVLIGEINTLYVDSGLCKIPGNTRLIKEIKRSDSSRVFDIVTIDK